MTAFIMASVLVPRLSCGETVTTTVPVGVTPRYIAVNPVTNKVYVVNYGDKTVTVIDGNTNAQITTLAVRTYPAAVTVNPVSNKVYVANQEQSGYGTVTVIDGATDTVSAPPVPVEFYPSAITVNPVTNKVYVANSYSSSVTVIDGATDTVSGLPVTVGMYPWAFPIAIAVNTSTNKVYVVCKENVGNGTVTVIDGDTDTVSTPPVPVGSVGSFDSSPIVIVVNPATSKVYVANELSDNVTVIDGATNTTTTLDAPSGQVWDAPRAIAVNTETNKVYVTNRDSNNVTVIDGATNITTTLAAPSGHVWEAPYAVAVNPGTNKVYVANRGSNNITVIDGVTNNPSTLAAPSGQVWTAPRAIAMNPETNKVYVANELSGNVTVIQNFYTVSITKAGTGAGTVTSSPAGISCGTTCSAALPEGPAVVLFQTPGISSGFSGWGGACNGTGDCAFSMLSDKVVSADFTMSPPVKNQSTGVAYNILQEAYNEAKNNHIISALKSLTAAGLYLNKTTTLTIEGGYNADFSSCIGLTPVLGRVNVRLAPLRVQGLAIRPAP